MLRMSALPTSVPFGKRVRELRTAAGITQRDLADLTGIDPSTVGKIERGTANPNLSTIGRIAFALGVTVADLCSYITLDDIEQGTARGETENMRFAEARLQQLRQRITQESKAKQH